MQNRDKSCIFEHYGFTYVCDFENMLMWVTAPKGEDDDDPVTVFEIQRGGHKDWYYRHASSNSEFQRDGDQELVDKIEKFYTPYLNSVILGPSNGRKAYPSQALKSQRVRKAAVGDKA